VYYPGTLVATPVVSVPDAHVVFCGDLLWKDHIPNLIDASTPAWIKTLDAIEADYGESTWSLAMAASRMQPTSRHSKNIW